jgi:hypothetical protein
MGQSYNSYALAGVRIRREEYGKSNTLDRVCVANKSVFADT